MISVLKCYVRICYALVCKIGDFPPKEPKSIMICGVEGKKNRRSLCVVFDRKDLYYIVSNPIGSISMGISANMLHLNLVLR